MLSVIGLLVEIAQDLEAFPSFFHVVNAFFLEECR